MIKKLTALFVLVLAMSSSAFATEQDNAKAIQGIWKLVSYNIEVKTTGEKFPPMGEHPTGYTIFTPEGRTWFMLTGEGRKPATNDAEKAQLLNTMVAYTGKYRIEANQWITSVEVAWNPAWIGTEQARNFEIQGDKLQVLTPWRVMPNWADKGETRSIITFERVKN